MSEVAGLLILSSNYTLKDIVDNDSEVKVVTGASIQAAEITKLQELGWELEGPCVVKFKKEDLTEGFAPVEPRGMGPSPIVDFPPEVEPQPGSE